MSDSIGFKLDGFKELQAKFAALSDIDRKKFFVDEFKPIGDKITIAMKAQAPVSKGGSRTSRYASRTHPAGTLRESIGKKIGGNDIPTMWVSPRRRERRGMDAWYSHIVLGGHEYGGTRVAPNPFVRRAFDAIGPMIEMQLSQRLGNKLKALLR